MSFDRCLGFVLGCEGGLADNPADPGGKTLTGITQRTYDTWRQSIGLPPRDIAQLTVIEQRRGYAQMWERARCDQLPAVGALVFYDGVVNHGRTTATMMLQRVVGSAPDGAFGPKTMASLGAFLATHGEAAFVTATLSARETLYRALANHPGQEVFLDGWLARLHRLEAETHAFLEAP